MIKPTQKQIEEAKEYLRKRLDAELLTSQRIDDALLAAAKELTRIAYKYKIPPRKFSFSANPQMQREINAIIDRLRDTIEDIIITLAVPQEEDKNSIIPYVRRESYNDTLRGRIDKYTDRYKKEVEAAIAGALVIGMVKSTLDADLRQHLNDPFEAPSIIGSKIKGEDVMGRLHTQSSFGRGRVRSSATALETLGRYSVGEGWMYGLALSSQRKGANGYWVMRGSSYPCELCDSEVGFHADWDTLPQYHSHCKCIAIPMY